jgi:ankyrin repeat protein
MKIPKTGLSPSICRGVCMMIALLGCARGDAAHPWSKHPLHNAIKKGDTERSLALIEKGTRLNRREYYSMSTETPLYRAAAEGQEEVVAALLRAGADLCLEEERTGLVPLHAAAVKGHRGVVTRLLDAGADINVRDDYGNTPLLLSAGGGHQDVVGVLLRRTAEVNARNRDGITALMLAARAGDVNCVTALVKSNADLNAQCVDSHWAALHFAAYNDRTEVVDYLIRAGTGMEPVPETPEGLYAMAVGSKLLARHSERSGSAEAALKGYTAAGDYYQRAQESLNKKVAEISGELTDAAIKNVIGMTVAFATAAMLASVQAHVSPSGQGVALVPYSTVGTGSLKQLREEYRRKQAECVRCIAACRQIVEWYNGGASREAGAENGVQAARESLGLR